LKGRREMRYTGVTSRGIICPIFRQGDDLVAKICDSLENAAKGEGFSIDDGDIISVTEAVLARTQGNYATTTHIAKDVKNKLGGKDIGIVFPILSRNRFAVLLKGISMACEKLYVQLSYPSDEVGNSLISLDDLDESGIDPYRDSFDEADFRRIFGDKTVHKYTGVDYIEYYKSINNNIEIVFSNDPGYILSLTENVLVCDIHTRFRTQKLLKKAGAKKLYRLDEILTESIDGSGYNEEFGLLGSNKADEDTVKLFPRDCNTFVLNLQDAIADRFKKHVEVMIYGDGGFKDPVCGIWELADPVISPAYTKGLGGTANELKMKYFADNEFRHLQGEELNKAIREKIRQKDEKKTSLVGNMQAEGTTPRRLTDLLGSLSDLTSGSGDRGTPVVLIKGYFQNYASE
jgi:hypothetical protein